MLFRRHLSEVKDLLSQINSKMSGSVANIVALGQRMEEIKKQK
jgi:hypothetical protein